MAMKYEKLLSPIRIGPLTFKNRIFASPISLFDIYDDDLCTPSQKDINFYKLRAMGDAALVTFGDSIVHPTGMVPGETKILLSTDKIIPFLTDVTEEIHKFGAFASIELNHGGIRTARADRVGHGPQDGISDKGFPVAGMSRELIEEVAESFGTAAARCRTAGFDMVTLHAGHGWLLGNFLSPLTNHRQDEFGGSLENRARFTMMAIEAIRRHCGRAFPIEVRFSGSEMAEGGITLEEGVAFAKMLDGKVDILHVSAGTLVVHETEVITHPSLFLPHGCNVFLAEEIKKHVKTPVATVGSLSELAMMEEILASGKADIIAVGRALIADPALPRKARSGREEDIRPCLRCLNCLGGSEVTGVVRCSVNPVIGHEQDYFTPPMPYEKKKVLVVGGGPAGMQAALTAAERGHRVTLCEKKAQLGGLIRYSEATEFKHDLTDFMNYLIHQVEKAAVDVRLGCEATPELIAALSPDVVLLAVGSEPIVPPVPGVEKAVSIVDFYFGRQQAGKKVVIIGGGLAGCELAIELGKEGRDVSVVEMRGEWAADANPMHRVAMDTQIRNRGIKVYTSTACVGVEDGAVLCRSEEGELRLEADTIVLAAGMKPRFAVADALTLPGVEVVRIGDCRRAGQVKDAVRTGYDAARAIGLMM